MTARLAEIGQRYFEIQGDSFVDNGKYGIGSQRFEDSITFVPGLVLDESGGPSFLRTWIIMGGTIAGGILGNMWDTSHQFSHNNLVGTAISAGVSGIAISILFDNFHRVRGLFPRITLSQRFIG